ncbi:formylglycine-generating enzyme family protein [Runella salmonicolor]|uniref:Formylglycine-generating enzyme family protein n=1 Tax=Runella salmonicolor TaxID=2950278 RepID=A0ABT1FUZ6_9BACT|nr:formylglycine-generating enzyme family protein [Runella salmonicolor]MCP1385590.1 formylglycine-generating enzyme family protein [Runella salmonicolor]
MRTIFWLWAILFIPFLAPAQQITFDEYRRRADACLEREDYACAVQNYERALRIRENDAHCTEGLSKATQALKKPKLPKAKPSKPVANNPKPSTTAPPAIRAFLLVTTDLPVHVYVNGGTRQFVSPNDIAKKLPLDAGANLVVVKPTDGGSDGFEKTVTVRESGNQLLKINLLEERLAAEKQSKPNVLQPPTNALVNTSPKKEENPPKNYAPTPKTDALSEELSRLMVAVKGGTFQMGSKDEKPIHTVVLNDFYISKYEVTQRQWRNIMGTLPKKLTNNGCNDCPIEQVSWNEVQEFIKKLNLRTGQNFRLPTEAEWEYAARGGTQKSKNTVELKDAGWYRSNSGKKTHPVGQKLPNELGLYDMLGNVWEWCQDWYDPNFYAKSPVNNPVNVAEEKYRVIRGGSLDSGADATTLTTRDGYKPASDNGYVGFRLVHN